MTQLVLGQVLNGAIIGAMYGIIALGITLTFGITGIVNFALGEFMMIGAYATYALAERAHLPYAVAVGPACLIAAAAQAADKDPSASLASWRHPSMYREYASGCRGARRLASGPFSAAWVARGRLARRLTWSTSCGSISIL